MKISTLTRKQLQRQLSTEGLQIVLPPFQVKLWSDCPAMARDIHLAYADFDYEPTSGFCDFHLQIRQERHWLKPWETMARFYFDDRPSFVPLPARQAFTMFEWGLNWCIAAHAHQYLIIHAAVVEKNGQAILLPAPPGSGKSTLCAAMIQRGWRLLSDELALLDLKENRVFGMARPVNLKNASIEVIRHFAPQAQLTIAVPDTTKGTISLLKPPIESVDRVLEPATPCLIILPQYKAGSPTLLEAQSGSQVFLLLAEQSFNYDIHGERGFHRIGQLIDACDCYQLSYSQLDDAIATLDHLLEASQP